MKRSERTLQGFLHFTFERSRTCLIGKKIKSYWIVSSRSCTRIMSKNVFFGVISAAITPLAMTFGFILWGKSWKSSAYALNLFKCTFAATIFMLIAFSIRWTIAVTPYEESMIILSSILVIVIGDNTWLLSLQMIGAKRVIIIDTFQQLWALGSFTSHLPGL